MGTGSDSDGKYGLMRVAPGTGRATSVNHCVPYRLLYEISLSFQHGNPSHWHKHRHLGSQVL